MPRIVPPAWMPPAAMKRIICHWTAGGHHASSSDREHYHLLIEGDGRLVQGEHSIPDNLNALDGDYAAHTRGCNTGSIGVSVCCMLNAMESPFKPGPAPMTETQWEVMALVVADLCETYGIPLTPTTVLGHGEVQANLGKVQNGKWDPLKLPWAPHLGRKAVGEQFRERVRALLDGAAPTPGPQAEQLPPIRLVVDGELLTDEGVLKGDVSWCPLRLLADDQGWTILDVDADSAQVRTPAGDLDLVAMIRGERGYVQVRDVVRKLKWPGCEWNGATRTLEIGTKDHGS